MFEKRECRAYNGVRKEQVYQRAVDFWSRNGFYVFQLAPYNLHGQSFYSNIGLKREFRLSITESGQRTYIDLQLSAKITDEGIIGGTAAAVLFFPVAVVGGVVSYDRYENDAAALMHGFWLQMDGAAGVAGAPVPITVTVGAPVQVVTTTAPTFAPSPAAQQSVPCPACGALLPQEWKACPYCGKSKA